MVQGRRLPRHGYTLYSFSATSGECLGHDRGGRAASRSVPAVIHVGTGLTLADFKDKGTATVQGAQCPFTTRGDAVDSRTTSLPASVIRLSGFLPESSSSRI